MANKKISDFTQSTVGSAGHLLLVEIQSGAYRKQTRQQLHTLYTSEEIDSATGVNTLIKSGGNLGITIDAATGDLTLAQDLTVTGVSTFTGMADFNGGIRDTNDRFFVPDVQVQQRVTGNDSYLGGNGFTMVIPALPDGATTATLSVLNFAQAVGTVGSVTVTVNLVAADGSEYTANASFTPTNLGSDHASSIQSILDTAEASFATGESRSIASGDLVLFKANSSAAELYILNLAVQYT